MNLLMISGDRALAEGKRGAFYNTLEELHKYWERIDVICPRGNLQLTVSSLQKRIQGGSSNWQLYTDNCKLFDNVFIHSSPWPLWLQPWWILKKGREIYREHKFDLITVHEYSPFYNGIGARLLWDKIRIPYVLEIHHIPGHPKAVGLKEWLYKIATCFFIRYDVAKAKAVRVVNQHQVPEFLIRAGVPENKIIYIPSLYIDLDIFKPTEVEKKYDLIFVGRLTKNKGIGLLLRAMSNIKIQMPSIKLLVVGDGPLLEDLKLKTRNYKLETNVIFHGWAKDSAEVASLLNQSRILIMPSYNEGGPRVVLEAMACGVPVLATPVGIAPDIIKDGKGGGIIDWKAEDIATKAAELLGNKEEYGRCSLAGLEIAKQFERRTMIKNYAEKLQKSR